MNLLISPFGGAGVVCLKNPPPKTLNITSWHEKGTFQISFYLTMKSEWDDFILKLDMWSYACMHMHELVLLLKHELKIHSNKQDKMRSNNMMNYASFYH